MPHSSKTSIASKNRNAFQTPNPSVLTETREDGIILLRSPLALAPVFQSLPHIFDATAAKWPERVFMRQRPSPGAAWREISYADAARASRGLAQWLLDHGGKPGDAVAVLSGPSIEHGIVTIGVQRVRIAVAPLSPAYSLVPQSHEKLKNCVARAGARFVFADDAAAFSPAMYALAGLGVTLITARGDAGGLDCFSWQDVIATPPTADIDRQMAAITPDTIAKIMHTSGSTGSPKAVPQPQSNLTVTVAQNEALGLLNLGNTQPQFLEAMPFSHIMAGNFNFNNMIRAGGAISLDDGKPTAQLFHHTIANLQEISPHVFLTVPAGFAMLCDALEADATLAQKFFSKLVWMGFGGAVLSDSITRRLNTLSRQILGREIPIFTFYGATEYLFGALKYWVSPRMDVIGLPLPSTELKLVPRSEKYELWVRSPTLMPRSGYLGDAASSDKLFDDEGYFNTGDAVRFFDSAMPEQGLVFDGRLAEDFKLSTGTWVSVGALRQDFLAACEPLVMEAVICGLNQDYAGVLIWLNEATAKLFLGGQAEGIPTDDIITHPNLVEALRQRIIAFNAVHPVSSRRIGSALIMRDPLSYQDNEITDKGNANQRLVRERRMAAVSEIFDKNGMQRLSF